MKQLIRKRVNGCVWFDNQVKNAYKAYQRSLKNGMIDPGFVWTNIKIQIFLEGVFTGHPVPGSFSVKVPGGKLVIGTIDYHWFIRNDYGDGGIGDVDVKRLFDSIDKWYPDGINYEDLALQIMSVGCTEEQMAEIYDKIGFMSHA